MQHSKVKEEGLEVKKTTQRLALLRLGSTTSTTTDHEGHLLFIDPSSSASATMKRRSPSSSSSLQELIEPKNKKILVDDPISFNLPDNVAAAGVQSKNPTVSVTASPQQQQEPQFPFSAPFLARSISGPPQFPFSATPATTSQGQGTHLRRCSSVPVPPLENDDGEFNIFRDPAAPPSIPASLVRSESFLSPQPQEENRNSVETDATLPLRRPSVPRPPASISIPPTILEKTGMISMAEQKDSSRSSESSHTVVTLPESPAEKRLTKMKRGIVDIQKWCNEVVQEDDAVISAQDRATSTNVHNIPPLEEVEIPPSEMGGGVTVEREGRGGFCIHYWCDCGRRSQVHLCLSDPTRQYICIETQKDSPEMFE